jgi:hypothetical protein
MTHLADVADTRTKQTFAPLRGPGALAVFPKCRSGTRHNMRTERHQMSAVRRAISAHRSCLSDRRRVGAALGMIMCLIAETMGA